MSARSEHLRQWARELAEHGWPVFPLRPGSKVPALHGRDRCPATAPCSSGHAGWEHRATTDAAVIDRCWDHDGYNIGLATGPAELVVLDLDVAKPGETAPDGWNMLGISSGAEVLDHLAHRAHATVPPTYTVTTASGGQHRYYRAPRGIQLRNTAGVLGWLVDTRAHGGYVVAPGSILETGAYELYDDRDPVELPGWLVQALTPTPSVPDSGRREITSAHRSGYLRAALDAETRRVTAALSGTRNQALYIAACALGQLVAGDAVTEQEVTDRLLHAAQDHVAAGAYPWHQARQTIASGMRAGAKRPRKVAA